MVLIRLIVLKCLVHNVRIYVRHVRTNQNPIADSLSHFQHQRFKGLTASKHMEENPTEVPQEIWPFDKIWLD